MVNDDFNTGTGGRFSGNAGDDGYNNFGQQDGTSRKRGLPVGLIIVAAIGVIMILIFVFVGIMFSQMADTVRDFSMTMVQEMVPEYNYGDYYGYDYDDDYYYGDDYYGYDEDYTYQEYIPNPSDEYLKSIVSSTVRGLSYEIAWYETYIYADDENNGAIFYCYYPVIIGSDAGYVADVNAAIRGQAVSYMPETLEAEAYGYLDAYVTYMSEDVLSVVFIYYYDFAGEESYHISALNFNMKTGEQFETEEMLPDFEFISDFRKKCKMQNGEASASVLEDMTDDEIMKEITNPETGVVFWSPVGLDVGFNYPDGWMTATLKFATY